MAELTRKDCIYVNKKMLNCCAIIKDEYDCDPENCVWRKTDEMMFQSLYKAMQNYEKKTGRKDYINKYVLGSTLRERFKNWLRKQAASAADAV